MFHCSIIGTCLTPAELRQFFVKLRQPDAKTATDHGLHSRGVYIAGKRDDAAKLLQKTIDKRHEIAIKRFAKAATVADVRALWLQALTLGDIPGAYWASLTHPKADRPLAQEVFGEVHMLSHLVGSSNRLDIARLRKLELELGASAEKIARQQERILIASQERSDLIRLIEELRASLSQQTAREWAKPDASVALAVNAALKQRLDAEREHTKALRSRCEGVEHRVCVAEERAADLLEENKQLQCETTALEAAMKMIAATDCGTAACAQDLLGVTLLYVGGRPKLLDHLKAITVRRGGALLTHDGGIEDNPALLPGLVSQADQAFFPMDCVSHTAVGKLKKVCRDAGKPFIPLRTASIASFVAAIGHGDDAGRRSLAP